MSVERRTILFTGRVQGVGFRMTTIQLSRGLDLAGEVRNCADGAVEIIAEGEPRALEALVRRLREHFGALIRTVQQSSAAPLGLDPGMRITY